jgi:SanA protein
MRKLKLFIGVSFVFLLVVLISCNVWVVLATQKHVFNHVDSIPHRSVALVLGTSNRLTDGSPNPFFTNRIETAYQLFKSGKIDHIVVSGDNRSRYYNEPVAMRNALIKMGVPSSVITLDFAGLRTLDSIVRCKEIFGQESVTIITQSFHSYRALFISQYYKMDALVMVADEPGTWQSTKVIVREILARPLAILDLYVFKTSPRFLGNKEELNTR